MKRALIAATAVALIACGPRVKPRGPAEEPSKIAATTGGPRPATRSVAPSQEVLIGEMCPSAVSGRPGVMPLVMRRLSWDDDRDNIAEVLERNMARQFSVLGWDGRRVGVFTVAGAATSPNNRTFASGSYAGGSACEIRVPGAEPRPEPECEKTLYSCALAIATLRPVGAAGTPPFEEDPDPTKFETGGVCAADGKVIVDIDGDGKTEAFPAAAFLDPFRAPAEEVSAVATGRSKCEPRFAARAVLPATDPRDWRGLDVVGVLDLDSDGRFEIIAIYNYQGRRTWAVYSAQTSSGRLDLVGESVPWPRPD